MTKTNKEIRSEFAKEMRDKYNERNEELNRIKKSSYSKGLKEQKRKEIMDNFYAEIDEIKKRPGYEEARKAHLEEIKAKSGIRKAKTVEETTKENVKENLSEEYIDFCSEIIKDPAYLKDKNGVIKELLKYSNGIEWLKSFLMSNDADCKMENKILIMKTCIQESDNLNLRNQCGLSEFINLLLSDLNGINILKEITHPKNTEINTKTKILIIKNYLKESTDFKLRLATELGLTNYIESLLLDLGGKINNNKKIQQLTYRLAGKDGWIYDSEDYNKFFHIIETIETELKEIIKENKIIKNSKLLSNDSLSKSINLQKYAKDNIWNVTFTSDPHIEYGTYFKYKINFEDLQKEIINYMKTKIYEQGGIKAKCDILPELLFLENLSSEIKNGKQDKKKWNEVFDGLAVDFKNQNYIPNLIIINKWYEDEFKEKAKEILKNFGWKNYNKEANEYQEKLSNIKQAIKDYGYDFITLPDDETGNNATNDDKKEIDNLNSILNKNINKTKTENLNACYNYDSIKSYLKKYGIKRNITDHFIEIFFNKLGLGYNYGFCKGNENVNKNKKLEERRFNSIKTFLLTTKPNTTIDEDKLEKYIFEKIFSTHYEYSNCEDKKNLIKYFLKEWRVDIEKWNCNEKGLNFNNFLNTFYEETNMAFAQNFQNWNKRISDIKEGGLLKSDIIEAIMKIAINNAQDKPTAEKIFNILKAPICHKEDGKDFGFNFADDFYDHTNGAWIKDGKTKDELFKNIRCILGDSTSNPPSRIFKINGRGGGTTHNAVYTDQHSGVPMICINDTYRFLLKYNDTGFTILGISGHKCNTYDDDIRNAKENK